MNHRMKTGTGQHGVIAILATLGMFGLIACQEDVHTVQCGDVQCGVGQVCVNQECVAGIPCADDLCKPDTQECVENQCVDTEPSLNKTCDEVQCNDDEVCVNGKCEPKPSGDACANVTCKEGSECVDGNCVQKEPCATVSCLAGKSCLAGYCVDDDCIVDGSLKACESGKICSKGECVDDGCADVSCSDEETCVAGKCLETACLTINCESGTSCKGGVCLENACLDVSCENGEVCQGGDCIKEACKSVVCTQDKICNDSGDCVYDSDPALAVVIVNNDNKTDESGKTASLQVSLNHQPTSDVKVSCVVSNDKEASVDCAESGLVFTENNWNQPQQVVVTGLSDNSKDGDQNYVVSFESVSEDAAFNELKGQAELVNEDKTTNGLVIVAPDGLITSEAGSSVLLQISLSSAPASDVTFSISSSDETEGLPGLTSMTFTSENWNVPQELAVFGVNDEESDGSVEYDIIFSKLVSEDPNFNDIETEALTFTNQDDDSAGVTIPGKKVTVDEKDLTVTIPIVLNTKPEAEVTVSIAISDDTEAAASVESVVFTLDNWDTPQNVVISGVADEMVDGSQPFEITFSISSEDKNYDDLKDIVVKGVTQDSDVAGIAVRSDGNLTLTEGDDTEVTFQIALTSKPTADVTVKLLSGDTSELAIAGETTLVFTTENWNVYQDVSVKSADDYIVDGQQKAAVKAEVSSEDKEYKKLSPEMITFAILDNDKGGFVITGEAKALAEETGETATFTVAMLAQPQYNVTVTLTSSDSSELIVDKNVKTLTFTGSNWNKPQTVTVKTVDDPNPDGNQQAWIALSAKSSDKAFNGLTAESPIYTIIDDESASIVVSPTNFVWNPGDNSASFNVHLGSEPTADVTVTLTSSDPNLLKFSKTLTFTQSNWSTDQKVNVTLGEYAKGVATEAITLHSTSACSAYNTDKIDQKVNFKVYAFQKQAFSFTGSAQQLTLYPAKYKLQVWGASGGDHYSYDQSRGSHAGLAGHAYGTLDLQSKTDVFVQVGGVGGPGVCNNPTENAKSAGYNGGGVASCYNADISQGHGFGGGGSTDIRLGQDSIYARVIVAGGGGGADNWGASIGGGDDGSGGVGGGEIGGKGYYNGALYDSASGGTQSSGSGFYQGGNVTGSTDAGGGGGGWWGGYRGANGNCGGAGGSGFVYTSSTPASVISSSTIGGTWLLNSTHQLTDAKTIAGSAEFDNVSGDATEKGHAGNGYAIITLVE